MSDKTEVLDLFVFVEVVDGYGYAFMSTTPSPFTYAFGSQFGLFRLVWKDATRYAREVFLASTVMH